MSDNSFEMLTQRLEVDEQVFRDVMRTVRPAHRKYPDAVKRLIKIAAAVQTIGAGCSQKVRD